MQFTDVTVIQECFDDMKTFRPCVRVGRYFSKFWKFLKKIRIRKIVIVNKTSFCLTIQSRGLWPTRNGVSGSCH